MSDYQRAIRVAEATLPTGHGDFGVVAYREPATGKEHAALVRGHVRGERGVLCRIHSECLTGDVLGSRRCDCGGQLDEAMARMQAEGRGVLLYLRQEGRGIGLAEKVRAYALQDQGDDTVDANLKLGHPVDARTYDAARDILLDLGVQSVRLLTNNPEKVRQLERLGVEVLERVPHETVPHDHNRGYLAAKKRRMGHLLERL